LFQKVSPFLSMQGSSVILCHLCTAGCMACHRVLDLGAEVMLPPLTGKNRSAAAGCSITKKHFFLMIFVANSSASPAFFFPSQYLNKVLKIEMMQATRHHVCRWHVCHGVETPLCRAWPTSRTSVHGIIDGGTQNIAMPTSP